MPAAEQPARVAGDGNASRCTSLVGGATNGVALDASAVDAEAERSRVRSRRLERERHARAVRLQREPLVEGETSRTHHGEQPIFERQHAHMHDGIGFELGGGSEGGGSGGGSEGGGSEGGGSEGASEGGAA